MRKIFVVSLLASFLIQPTISASAAGSVAACKLPVADGRGDVAIGGWPRIKERMKSTGTVISQVITVDFSDAPAKMTPAAAFAKIAGAADTFKEMSYGKFNYKMVPTTKWYRMSKPSTGFTKGAWTFDAHKAYILEAVKLADKDVDFSKSDSFIILANPDAKGIGYSGPAFAALGRDGITVDGRYITNGATSAADLNGWGSIWANHELTHTLGMIDLYTFNPEKYSNNGFPYTGEFSYMGLSSFESNSPSLLAFERWNLGWIADSQIVCAIGKSTTQKLTPIEKVGGTKAIVVPINKTKAVVVESRRALGIDKKMKKTGALVYVVDSKIESGMGAVKVYPMDLKNDPRFLKSPRAAGEFITIEGVTVKVKSAGPDGDTVAISRN